MLPKELFTQAPLIDLEGNKRMRIENYQSILEFTDEVLRLRMLQKGLIYKVQGKNLLIRGVTKREIFLEGHITGLVVEGEEKK